MEKHKFKLGDIVALDGPRVKSTDPNYGIQGKVVGYEDNPFEECPIVDVFSQFLFGNSFIYRVKHLDDDWWTLVEDLGECYCSSLL